MKYILLRNVFFDDQSGPPARPARSPARSRPEHDGKLLHTTIRLARWSACSLATRPPARLARSPARPPGSPARPPGPARVPNPPGRVLSMTVNCSVRRSASHACPLARLPGSLRRRPARSARLQPAWSACLPVRFVHPLGPPGRSAARPTRSPAWSRPEHDSKLLRGARKGDCIAQQLATWTPAPPRQVAVYKYPSPRPVLTGVVARPSKGGGPRSFPTCYGR